MNEPLLSMKEAAQYLGLTMAGMRKLVARSQQRLRGLPMNGRTIMFYQAVPRGDIKFRPRWLEDYIDRCTHDPESAPLRTLTPKRKAIPQRPAVRVSASGFDSSLLQR